VEDCIEFYRGNAEELSMFLPVEPYDLIYSFGVIHHTPHPERVIAQMRNYCLREAPSRSCSITDTPGKCLPSC